MSDSHPVSQGVLIALEFADALAVQEAVDFGMVIFSLIRCPPCIHLSEAVEKAAADFPPALQIFKCTIDADDKKALGRALLSGLEVFPTVRVVRNGRVVHSFRPAGHSPREMAEFLVARTRAIE